MSRASSSRSSPTASTSSTGFYSPPAARTRSRKHSNENVVAPPVVSTSSKGKGKAKQVEFDDEVQIAALPDIEQDSDLTDLAELEESIGLATPSPRRLRSKGDRPRSSSQGSDGEVKAGGDVDLGRRVTPMRKAKRNVGSLKEDDTEEEEEDQLFESDAEDVQEEAEDPSTPMPNRTRRTPLRDRLRSRQTQAEAPSDGDDEGSDDESVDVGESVDGEEDEEEQEADDETIREDSEEEGSVAVDEEPMLEHRVLRNGKVVGEDETLEDEDEVLTEASEEDAEGEEVDEDAESYEQDAASIDLEHDIGEEEDAQAEDTDESMEDGTPRHIFADASQAHLT